MELDFPSGWYLPSQFVSDALAELGFNITIDELEACNMLLWIEVLALTKLDSYLIYPYFANQSEFLVNNYQDWYIGGVDEMACMTQQKFRFSLMYSCF